MISKVIDFFLSDISKNFAFSSDYDLVFFYEFFL